MDDQWLLAHAKDLINAVTFAVRTAQLENNMAAAECAIEGFNKLLERLTTMSAVWVWSWVSVCCFLTLSVNLSCHILYWTGFISY